MHWIWWPMTKPSHLVGLRLATLQYEKMLLDFNEKCWNTELCMKNVRASQNSIPIKTPDQYSISKAVRQKPSYSFDYSGEWNGEICQPTNEAHLLLIAFLFIVRKLFCVCWNYSPSYECNYFERSISFASAL